MVAAAQMEFFAGFVTEMKGNFSIRMGPDVRISRCAQPLAWSVASFRSIIPSCSVLGQVGGPARRRQYRDREAAGTGTAVAAAGRIQIGGLLPPGVFNVVPGGREAGQVLASHPDVAMIALIGSAPTGRAVMKAAADTVKVTDAELGGKNALIAFGDADPDEVAVRSLAA